MVRRILTIVMILSVLFLVSACTTDKLPENQTPEVSIENNAFQPNVVTVELGTTVTWTNNQSVAHNVIFADFSSPLLEEGETFTHKFDKAGTYTYKCGIHPSMTGKIIVKPAAQSY